MFTPYADFFVGMLNQAGSSRANWKLGETQDVCNTDALFFAPTSQYSKEYDLLNIDGNKLHFGKRLPDSNMGSPDKRPTELAHPVVKQG
jgi:hypothetical protein